MILRKYSVDGSSHIGGERDCGSNSSWWIIPVIAVIAFAFGSGSSSAMTVDEAARRAVKTNPEIGVAAANRRAVDHEFNQAIGRFLPKINLTGETGRQRVDRPESLDPVDNKVWRNNRKVTLSARQVIFKGFERVNQLYRQAARVDAAAYRVWERSEAIALKAVEVYLDYLRLAQQRRFATTNVNAHEGILTLVRTRQAGGKASDSEVFQVEERTSLARAILGKIRQEQGEVAAEFKRVVGIYPSKLAGVRLPRSIPRSFKEAVSSARSGNTSLQVADADVDASYFQYKSAKAPFLPTISLDAAATRGEDLNGISGRNDDLSAKLSFSWNLFNGTIDYERKMELADRWGEAQLQRDVRRREIHELIDKAWAVYTRTNLRINALANRKDTTIRLVNAYREEYELERRSLLDLLDGQNALFNSQVELYAIQSARKFAAYQLLASTGRILPTMHVEKRAESYGTARDRLNVNGKGSE